MQTEVTHKLLNDHIPAVCNSFFRDGSRIYCSTELWEMVFSAANNSIVDDIHSIFFLIFTAGSYHFSKATRHPLDFEVIINSCPSCPDWQDGNDRIYFMQALKLPNGTYIRLASDSVFPEELNHDHSNSITRTGHSS